MITAAELKRLLSYSPRTGEFRWRVQLSNKGPVGAVAGSVRANGYVIVGIHRKTYRAHRLAWLYVTGRWPATRLDHKNGNRADNRLSNLRLATNQQNAWNMRRHRDAKHQYKGVSWFPNRTKPWMAQIAAGGKRMYLGYHETQEQAALAYNRAAKKLYGKYARENEVAKEEVTA